MKQTLKSPWFYPLAACFLLIFLFAFRRDIDYDIGFHLRAGQWILENHSFPQKDVFTYTVNQNDYVDLHWLYQVAEYLVYQGGGYAGLSLVHLVLILAAFSLTVLRMRLENPPPWAYAFLLLPAVLAIEIRFLVRPEIVSWVLLIFTLLILDLRANHQRNFLFLLPLIQVLWVNVEGLFILGWVAMGAYWIGGWIHSKRPDPALLKFGLLSLAADLLNPYFLRGVFFPFLLFTRLQGSNVFKHYISEFQSPWSLVQDPAMPFLPAIPIYAYRIFGLVLLVLVGMDFKRRKAQELLLVAAFFFLSCAAIRNVPLFFWVALPVAAAALKNLLTFHPLPAKLALSPASSRKLAVALALGILLAGARVATRAYYVSDRRVIHTGLGLDEDRFPIKAAQFMGAEGLHGRLLNDLAFGGWLIWKGPSPVFIDGRLEVVQEDLFTQYRDSFYPGGLMPLLSRWDVRFILFDPMMNTQWFTQLRTMPDWRLVYFDDVCALYARKDAAVPGTPTSWAQRLRQYGLDPAPSDSILTGLADRHPSPLSDWFSGFFRPQNYPMPLFRLGAFAYENGEFEAARAFFLEMLRETSGKYFEVYFNLGVTYQRLNRPDLANLCFEKALELQPGNSALRRKLGQT